MPEPSKEHVAYPDRQFEVDSTICVHFTRILGSAFMASAGSSGNGTAKGLVVNALVLWNTRYMDAALSQLRSQGAEVKPEDVARRPRTRSRLG